ncbi:unnamed protein product [Allacma fusca]|uniref:Cytochrome P450 n=1 Tax=Allacma fusca TaxID=39272 RepID=A0A8J2PD22_9HEXA|nr:unnamed protein product [Allacma fusca]
MTFYDNSLLLKLRQNWLACLDPLTLSTRPIKHSIFRACFLHKRLMKQNGYKSPTNIIILYKDLQILPRSNLQEFIVQSSFHPVFATFWIFKLSYSSRKTKLLDKFPSPLKFPLIDHAWMANVHCDDLLKKAVSLRRQHGERYRLKFGPHNYIMIANPDDVEKLLTSTTNIEKGQTYSFIVPWLGDGLLTSKGAKWQFRRKMLTPSFHFKILEDFLIIFNEQSNIFVDILREEFKDTQAKDICRYITRCALDIVGETAMDIKFNTQTKEDNPYVKAIYKACEIVQFKAIRPWHWVYSISSLTPIGREFNNAINFIHGFTDQVIQARKSEQGKEIKQDKITDVDEIYWHGKRRLAFLDLLLDAQKNPENDLSDLDLREEVDTFLFEGHDTVSASLGWTTFLLGCHPDYQEKVHEELDGIFGDDRTRFITSKDLTEMKYLEMCIKESLRLYPSVPFFSRTLSTDMVLDDEFTVPAGTNACLLTAIVHRNERVFQDPETFDPDRFLPENSSKRHPFAYIPFSAGPRNCIGQKFAMMEQKLVMANLFRNFKVEAAEKLEDVVVLIQAVTRPRDGLTVRLIPRS